MTADGLIARLEKATADEQRDHIEDAVIFAGQSEWISVEQAERAHSMIDAHAYENAALVLVPEGFDWRMQNNGLAALRPHDAQSGDYSEAATPALALAAAAFKARTEGQEPRSKGVTHGWQD